MALVEIDLDGVDFDDLLNEVIERFRSKHKLEINSEQALIRRMLKEGAKALNMISIPEMDNIKDEMKLDFAKELMERYSEDQLREMEKNYINKKPQ
jgi:hypothetical protein